MADSEVTTWRLEDSHPPMRVVEFRPLMTKVTAQLMLAAGVTCEEEWQIGAIGSEIEQFVIAQMRDQSRPHRIDFGRFIKEDSDG